MKKINQTVSQIKMEIGPFVFFNKHLSTSEDQKYLHERLPIKHEYGDRSATLSNGDKIFGRSEHDKIVDKRLRIKARKRCTLFNLMATHYGLDINRVQLETAMPVVACFVSVPDWHAEGLDVEENFLLPTNDDVIGRGPRIGIYTFALGSFIESMYEDLVMSITVVRQLFIANKIKCHLKIIPLGVGPTIRTRYGQYLGPYLISGYLLALQYACNSMLTENWVDTVEIVDHSAGKMTPTLDLRKIRIISNLSRDVLDFSGSVGWPAVICPCDSFCRIGSVKGEKNLASTIAENTNLRSFDISAYTYINWPFSP